MQQVFRCLSHGITLRIDPEGKRRTLRVPMGQGLHGPCYLLTAKQPETGTHGPCLIVQEPQG